MRNRPLIEGLLISSLVLLGVADIVEAHAPTSIELQYDFVNQVLSVTITHESLSTSTHYIDKVTIYRNDIEVLQETYTSQPEPRVFTYEYDVTAVDNDVLKATVSCTTGQEDEAEITVVGPREYMILSVNPEPLQVEVDDEVDMTVNIYRENDMTPLDGVVIAPSADLGYIGEVSDLGLGGYGFTYISPNLDAEDIEVMNLSCTKNGYHPLYYELSFNIVMASDDSKSIVVSIKPIFYNIDEGVKKTIDVEVKAGGSFLDVNDIDVDYSKGKLTKSREGAGKYTLIYTANQVEASTTAYITVTATMTGYVEGSRQVQFQINDVGNGGSTDTNSSGGLDYNTIFIVGIIALIIILIVVIVLIFRNRNKPEEVLVVEAEEVIDQ